MRDGHDGQHEAVLAWLVRGAMRWYQDGRTMPRHPEAVETAIADWRGSVDLLLRYIEDRLVFDGERHVMGTESYQEFSEWLREHGHLAWSDQNFTARFGQHTVVEANGVVKKPGIRQSRKGLSQRPLRGFANLTREPVPKQYAAWLGVRFRDPDDEPDRDDDQGE